MSLTLRLICGYLLMSLQPFLTCIYETLLVPQRRLRTVRGDRRRVGSAADAGVDPGAGDVARARGGHQNTMLALGCRRHLSARRRYARRRRPPPPPTRCVSCQGVCFASSRNARLGAEVRTQQSGSTLHRHARPKLIAAVRVAQSAAHQLEDSVVRSICRLLPVPRTQHTGLLKHSC